MTKFRTIMRQRSNGIMDPSFVKIYTLFSGPNPEADIPREETADELSKRLEDLMPTKINQILPLPSETVYLPASMDLIALDKYIWKLNYKVLPDVVNEEENESPKENVDDIRKLPNREHVSTEDASRSKNEITRYEEETVSGSMDEGLKSNRGGGTQEKPIETIEIHQDTVIPKHKEVNEELTVTDDVLSHIENTGGESLEHAITTCSVKALESKDCVLGIENENMNQKAEETSTEFVEGEYYIDFVLCYAVDLINDSNMPRGRIKSIIHSTSLDPQLLLNEENIGEQKVFSELTETVSNKEAQNIVNSKDFATETPNDDTSAEYNRSTSGLDRDSTNSFVTQHTIKRPTTTEGTEETQPTLAKGENTLEPNRQLQNVEYPNYSKPTSATGINDTHDIQSPTIDRDKIIQKPWLPNYIEARKSWHVEPPKIRSAESFDRDDWMRKPLPKSKPVKDVTSRIERTNTAVDKPYSGATTSIHSDRQFGGVVDKFETDKLTNSVTFTNDVVYNTSAEMEGDYAVQPQPVEKARAQILEETKKEATKITNSTQEIKTKPLGALKNRVPMPSRIPVRKEEHSVGRTKTKNIVGMPNEKAGISFKGHSKLPLRKMKTQYGKKSLKDSYPIVSKLKSMRKTALNKEGVSLAINSSHLDSRVDRSSGFFFYFNKTAYRSFSNLIKIHDLKESFNVFSNYRFERINASVKDTLRKFANISHFREDGHAYDHDPNLVADIVDCHDPGPYGHYLPLDAVLLSSEGFVPVESFAGREHETKVAHELYGGWFEPLAIVVLKSQNAIHRDVGLAMYNEIEGGIKYEEKTSKGYVSLTLAAVDKEYNYLDSTTSEVTLRFPLWYFIYKLSGVCLGLGASEIAVSKLFHALDLTIKAPGLMRSLGFDTETKTHTIATALNTTVPISNNSSLRLLNEHAELVPQRPHDAVTVFQDTYADLLESLDDIYEGDSIYAVESFLTSRSRTYSILISLICFNILATLLSVVVISYMLVQSRQTVSKKIRMTSYNILCRLFSCQWRNSS
uniref:Uncharacterized protein n=1 Tax=Babesia bovis TaxID=5865 RepID=A7ASE2_BABBO|eukprot:XP_001611029.1 hypothetical protein [Babesia bovis T2Bo]